MMESLYLQFVIYVYLETHKKSKQEINTETRLL